MRSKMSLLKGWMRSAMRVVFRLSLHLAIAVLVIASKLKKKNGPGRHAAGDASDIAVVSGSQRFIIVDNAIRLGFNGIGVVKGFIHVDTRDTARVIWTY